MTKDAWSSFDAQCGDTDNVLPSLQDLKLEEPHLTRGFTLKHLGLIEINGPQRLDFLQGQLATDMKALSDSQVQLSCYCNLKGKILASMYIFLYQDTVMLQVSRALIPKIIDTLNFYARFSKVKIQDVSDNWFGISIYGDLSKVDAPHTTSIQNELLALDKTDSNSKRIEYYAKDINSLITLWPQSINRRHESTWTYLNIQSGLTFINDQTCELFVPHQLNYHLLGGISVDKGCYLGQEIIARMHFKGKLTNRLYYVTLMTRKDAIEGKVIRKDDKPLATVVNAVQFKDNLWHAIVDSKQQLTASDNIEIDGAPVDIKSACEAINAL